MSAQPNPVTTRVCRKCNREMPLTEDYFRRTAGLVEGWRGTCRKCNHDRQRERAKLNRDIADKVRAAPAAFRPRVVGQDGPDGGYTLYPDDGYRFMCVPDSHGRLIDWESAHALLAFVRWYKPVRIFLLGDHVDFDAFSRFDGPHERIAQLRDDLHEWRTFATELRRSAPDARMEYHKGNHEHRFQKWLWKHPEMGALAEWQGMDLPSVLGLGEHGMEWVESGTTIVNERLMVKHGHMVRQRSGYTATGEMERNGITGISGHTHRLGQVYKRNRTGIMTWVESGCICKYDPAYMEGQLSDWVQGLSFGTISLVGNGFSVHTAPIIKGKVLAGGASIGA